MFTKRHYEVLASYIESANDYDESFRERVACFIADFFLLESEKFDFDEFLARSLGDRAQDAKRRYFVRWRRRDKRRYNELATLAAKLDIE